MDLCESKEPSEGLPGEGKHDCSSLTVRIRAMLTGFTGNCVGDDVSCVGTSDLDAAVYSRHVRLASRVLSA